MLKKLFMMTLYIKHKPRMAYMFHMQLSVSENFDVHVTH